MRPGDEFLIDNIEQYKDLVKLYAPILHFHPREGSFCCYTSDAEKDFIEYGSDWKTFSKDLSPNDMDPQAPCYYEVWRDESMLQIRYWFWYRFNRFPGTVFGLGDHLGDWEHVEIRLYDFPDERSRVWFLSNHLTARLVLESNVVSFPGLVSEGSTFTENNIHVWVALGSHANYPSPSSTPYCYARVFCDKIEGGGEAWRTDANLIHLHRMNFSGYTGRWGDTKAPRSPTNDYNNRWRNTPEFSPVL